MSDMIVFAPSSDPEMFKGLISLALIKLRTASIAMLVNYC